MHNPCTSSNAHQLEELCTTGKAFSPRTADLILFRFHRMYKTPTMTRAMTPNDAKMTAATKERTVSSETPPGLDVLDAVRHKEREGTQCLLYRQAE